MTVVIPVQGAAQSGRRICFLPASGRIRKLPGMVRREPSFLINTISGEHSMGSDLTSIFGWIGGVLPEGTFLNISRGEDCGASGRF